jgi:hypothetical protein
MKEILLIGVGIVVGAALVYVAFVWYFCRNLWR